MLSPTDNVLANQARSAQTAAIQGQTQQNAFNALTTGVEQMVMGPGRQEAAENALAMQEQQLAAGNMQNANAERELITQAIQGVKSAPEAQRAQVYGQIVRDIEAKGIDIPDWAEDFNNFPVIEGVYSMPPAEATALMRNISMLPEDQQMQALGVHFGITPSADAQLRGQTGDRPTTAMQEYEFARQQGFDGTFQQWKNDGKNQGFSVTTADGTTITQGRPMGRSANNTEEKSLASEVNLYSQLENVGKLAGLDENGRMVDPSMLTYKGQAKDFITRQAEKLGIEPSEVARQATFKRTQFITGVEQLFNAYRKEITGAAAAVQELDRLKKSFINMDMSPTQFEAAFQQYTNELQRSMRVRRKLLREGFDLRSKEGGDRMDSMFLSGGDDDPAARFVELAVEHGDEKAFEMMMQEGY